MLQHSSSAACLARPQRSSSLGPRAYSSAHLCMRQSHATGQCRGIRDCEGTASRTRLGMSDEETCSSSDASIHRHAHLQRSLSSIESRRPSTEGFEDAIEPFEHELPFSPAFDTGYSSYAFNLRTPYKENSLNTDRASVWLTHEELKRTTLTTPVHEGPLLPTRQSSFSRACASADGCEGSTVSPDVQKMSHQQNENESRISSPRGEETRMVNYEAAPAQEASAPEAVATNSEHEQPNCSEKNTRRDRTPRELSMQSRSSSQEAFLVVGRKKAINRYASVPAFSVSDQKRIDSFKEGLPQSLSTQEALRLRQESDERRKQEVMLRPNPFENSNDLTESVDWKSLLNAAGLGDVEEEDITLEAEELQAKLDEYVPRARFSWCGALWGCLWQWK